jgi:hypothetical protein
LPPRSGLERSDFVLWPFADKLDVRCHGSYWGSSGLAFAGLKWRD